jgi:aspartyl-tRNA synthetase
MKTTLRTHSCGELTKKEIGKKVKLCGWVDSLRPHGKIGFLNIRDRYGITQVFLNPKVSKILTELSKESVVCVSGMVNARPENLVNREMTTGAVEISAENVEIISKAAELPMQIDEKDIQSTEETRLKYRYLDLRSKRMQKNLILRHDAVKAVRDFLDGENFLELETPILAKSTPEGARDYLVPSRVNKGSFFALPQSPQLFKQLLMVSGYDRYFQVARCFRDEDLRADRQPEFTQLDMELSFIDEEDIYSLLENMVKSVWKKVLDVEIKIPFKRIKYADAMKEYGCDKPDIRKKGEKYAFCWVIDFPLLEYSEEDKRYYAMHHPFTSPKSMEEMDKDPGKIVAKAYDLVLNGTELGGGSIRISNHEMQTKMFELLGLKKEEYEDKFGFLLNAFKSGVPVHGGIALGLDRMISLMAGEESIREVIAFPKNKDAKDLMLDAPSEVAKEQLDELGIKKS